VQFGILMAVTVSRQLLDHDEYHEAQAQG